MTRDTDKPFKGLRVLDLSQGIAGPYCGSILSQQGADVIKVEPPGGDWARVMGPVRDGFTAIAIAYNAGKRSICIDTGKAEGRAILARIGTSADVIIQNFRPGVADRLGVGYEAMQKVNPKVLYVSISGFGTTGPYADLPAVDIVLQALNGMMAANKDVTGNPRRVNLYMVDVATGLYAAQLVGAHLYRQARDGSAGHHIELSLMEASAAFQSYLLVGAEMNSSAGVPAATAPSGIFQTADGFIILGAMNDKMFREICEALDRQDWLADSSMATGTQRLAHVEKLNAGVAEKIQQQSTAFWLEQFRHRDVVNAEVKDHRGFIDDPQAMHSNIFLPLTQPEIGTFPFPRHPGSPVEPAHPAPRNGEHTATVLAEYGYNMDEIASMAREKVIVCA